MSEKNRTFDWVGVVLIPSAYLTLVLWFDSVMTRSTVTPLFGIIGLLFFSFRLTPAAMAWWASVYSLTVVVIFMNHVLLQFLDRGTAPGDDLTPLLRSATFVTAAVLATLFCRVQHRLRQGNAGLTQILEKIPVPVITSDQDGRIRFANGAAASVAGLSSPELLGRSFFDLFADKDRQGATIADYLRRFATPHVGQPMALKCRGTRYLGTTQVMGATGQRLLLIILTEEDSRDPESATAP